MIDPSINNRKQRVAFREYSFNTISSQFEIKFPMKCFLLFPGDQTNTRIYEWKGERDETRRVQTMFARGIVFADFPIENFV